MFVYRLSVALQGCRERAKKIVSDCTRAMNDGLADTFTAPLFERNLRIINAGDRKAKLKEQSEDKAKSWVDLCDINDKLYRINDEIFFAACCHAHVQLVSSTSGC